MCKATGNSHHAPGSQPFLNFVLNWKFHTILNMGPKLRARKADEPSEELLDIRKKVAKLAKWMPGGEKNCSNRAARARNRSRPRSTFTSN